MKQRIFCLLMAVLVGLLCVSNSPAQAAAAVRPPSLSEDQPYATYVPILLNVTPYTGKVTDNGKALGGVLLTMIYTNDGGNTINVYGTTVTAANGTYTFSDPPMLGPNSGFLVYYENQDANKYPNWLYEYMCSAVDDTALDFKCDINVHDIVLKSPVPGTIAHLPVTFSWVKRPTPLSDNYSLDFYETTNFTQVEAVSGLGYVASYKLSTLPLRLSVGTLYGWTVSTNDADGHGIASTLYGVTFNNTGSAVLGSHPIYRAPGSGQDLPRSWLLRGLGR